MGTHKAKKIWFKLAFSAAFYPVSNLLVSGHVV